jgi:adenosine deaminase
VAPLLERQELVTLARNSFLGSFLDHCDVGRHLADIDAWVSRA